MNLTPSTTRGNWFRPFSLRHFCDAALTRLKTIRFAVFGAVPDGSEHALDRLRGPQVVPVLSREVVECQQRIDVLCQASNALRVFRGVFFLEGLDGREGLSPGCGMRYVAQVRGGSWLAGFREVVEHVRYLVKPATLMARAGEDLVHRFPEAEGAVADSQFRRDRQTAGLEIDQQFASR